MSVRGRSLTYKPSLSNFVPFRTLTWHARLFLNVRQDGTLLEDPDGEEFDTFEDAKAEAKACARDLMADAMRFGEALGIERSVEVTDESGAVVLTVQFRDAITW